MNQNFNTKLIVNPVSANGSTGRLWNELEHIIRREFGDFEFSFTNTSHHATELTREALRDGFEMVVTVGGDGTLNEVVNGFFDSGSPINPDAVLGVICRGTGSDFIKTIGIPKGIEAAARLLRGRSVKKCDVGRFTARDRNGKEIERYFINIADFGIGGEAVARVNSTTKAFGGFLSFLYGALKTIFLYKGKMVKLKIDDSYEVEKKINNVVVANGQYFGGGMRIAPEAEVDDGVFDIIIVDDLSIVESLINIARLYKGTHVNHPKVKCLRGKTVVAESPDTILIDVEGEDGGILPAKFDIMPGAIKVKIGG